MKLRNLRETSVRLRDLRVSAEGYTPRTESFEGEPHLVVPVVALVEGVVHAMNAAMPEFVAAREFSKQPAGWNGRPIFEGHPTINGRAISGNLPEVLAAKKIGTVFNAGNTNDKLAMEAWLHVKRCQRIAPALLARARAGEPIEISIGAFVDTTDVAGEHNGRAYRGAWTDITPDHLALLPEGTPGACSRTMGCGVRYAQDARLLDDDYRGAIGNGNNQYKHDRLGTVLHNGGVKSVKQTAKDIDNGTPFRYYAETHTVQWSHNDPTQDDRFAAEKHLNKLGAKVKTHRNAMDEVIHEEGPKDLIGNGNNQYTMHNAAADAHRAAGDAHSKAHLEHASVVGSLHESRNRAEAASAHAMGLSDTAEEATIATETDHRDHAASRSSDHAYQAANRAHDRADHEPGGDTANEHAAAAQHHYDAERAHRKAMSKSNLRGAIGNGNNQYTMHEAAAQAHEAAARAYEKVVDGGSRAAKAEARDKGTTARQATFATKVGDFSRVGRLSAGSETRDHAQAMKHHDAAAEAHRAEMKKLRNAAAATDDNPDFAGPNDSFPITTPDDVANAASALGRAKGDRAAIRRRIVAIAYRKGEEYVSALPDDWKRRTDTTRNASLFARLMTAARAAFRPALDADAMSDTDLKRRLHEALQEVEDHVSYVESYHPVTDPTAVVYCVVEAGDDPMIAQPCQAWYERSFELSDTGVVTLGDARVEVEPVMRYEPVEGAEPESDEPTTLIGNGNNQYTSANAAANAHEAAAVAHEKAATLNARAGKPSIGHDHAGKKASAEKARSDNAHTASVRAKELSEKVEYNSSEAHTNEHTTTATDHASDAHSFASSGQHSDAARYHTKAATEHKEAAKKLRSLRNAAAGAPGSSGDDAPHINQEEEYEMQKSEVLKALEGATDCQLTAIGQLLKPRSEAEIRAAVAQEAADKDAAAKAQAEAIRVAVEKAVADAKPKTFEAVLEQAPAEIKATFKAASDAVAARKVAALKALEGKDTGFSKEELEAKPAAEVEKIAKLAGATLRAAIDFGAQGVNGVDGEKKTEAPAPPDLGASIRAARAAGKK